MSIAMQSLHSTRQQTTCEGACYYRLTAVYAVSGKEERLHAAHGGMPVQRCRLCLWVNGQKEGPRKPRRHHLRLQRRALSV